MIMVVALALVLNGPASPGWSQSAGRYRVSVAGFRVQRPTWDNPLNRDGWGDEVYAAVVVQRFDRATGGLLEARTVSSRTHGDPTGFPDRVPQGHASDAGGLTAGDVVPFGWDERSPRPAVEVGRFPLVVWEGPLGQGGDVLVLRPTLWELDGDRTAFEYWLKLLAGSAAATWALTGVQQALRTTTAPLVPGIGRGADPSLLGSPPELGARTSAGPAAPGDLGPGRDHPIGVRGHRWYDQLLILDREKVDARLDTDDALLRLHLLEDFVPGGGSPTNGDYTLYLRIERVP